MLFSEHNSAQILVPKWASFLLNLGYSWPVGADQPRRIMLVSMPCDSAGAGLIVLGAMIRDFTNPSANDIEGHYDRLMLFARQFLGSCRDCETKCRPDIRRCGFVREASGQVRSLRHKNKAIEVDERTDFEGRQIALRYRDGRNTCLERPSSPYAVDFHIFGEPPPTIPETVAGLPSTPYEKIGLLLDGMKPICVKNLSLAYSGTCLAERMSAAAGQPATSRKMFENIAFHDGTASWTLDSLITINGWSKSPLSRVASFNARVQRLDRSGLTPRLVVADGHRSFLKVRDLALFGQADLIGVVDRNQTREDLEALKAKLNPDDWYCSDEDFMCALPPGQPVGMSISAIRRKA